MNTEFNPFQSPITLADDATPSVRPARYRAPFLIAWPFVFGGNMIIPIFLGWDLIEEKGFWGMILAALLLLVLGWVILISWPPLGLRITYGALITALSQLFPLIQLFLGLVAFQIAVDLGQATQMGDVNSASIDTELGGFIVTGLVGSSLLLVALGIGSLFFLFFSWRRT